MISALTCASPAIWASFPFPVVLPYASLTCGLYKVASLCGKLITACASSQCRTGMAKGLSIVPKTAYRHCYENSHWSSLPNWRRRSLSPIPIGERGPRLGPRASPPASSLPPRLHSHRHARAGGYGLGWALLSPGLNSYLHVLLGQVIFARAFDAERTCVLPWSHLTRRGSGPLRFEQSPSPGPTEWNGTEWNETERSKRPSAPAGSQLHVIPGVRA